VSEGVEVELVGGVMEEDGTYVAEVPFDQGAISLQLSRPASDEIITYQFTLSRTLRESYLKSSHIHVSNINFSDFFGFSIALSGDGSTLAVGSLYDDDTNVMLDPSDTSTNDEQGEGGVYVFRFSNGTWVPEARVRASDAYPDDRFGVAVSLSYDGNTLAVGAESEDAASDTEPLAALGSGVAYVFTRSGSSWTEQARLKASNPALERIYFGSAVALSGDGNTLGVGAYRERVDNVNEAGAVHFFRRSEATWTQDPNPLRAPILASQARFGSTLAFSDDGSRVVVGSCGASTEGADVFAWDGVGWVADSGNFSFGCAVSMAPDASVLAIGSFRANSGRGSVMTSTRADKSWSNPLVLSPGPEDANGFGSAVSISGNGRRLAVSACDAELDTGRALHSPCSGSVGIFHFDGQAWQSEAHAQPAVADGGDGFGFGAALSRDGATLAVSAPFEDSDGSGVANNLAADAGACYVFY